MQFDTNFIYGFSRRFRTCIEPIQSLIMQHRKFSTIFKLMQLITGFCLSKCKRHVYTYQCYSSAGEIISPFGELTYKIKGFTPCFWYAKLMEDWWLFLLNDYLMLYICSLMYQSTRDYIMGSTVWEVKPSFSSCLFL